MEKTSNCKIKFLGTGGARFVVTRQIRASGGLWYSLDGTEFLLDPGPGTLVKALSAKPQKDPTHLSGIILSHRHIDHSNDFNIMIEAMTEGGHKKRGEIFLPQDAIEGSEPVLFKYLHETVEKIHVLKENTKYNLKNIAFETSPLHVHGVNTFGFKFYTSCGVIAHLTDTRYFNELLTFYKSDILIINVVCFENDLIKSPHIKHLCHSEVINIISEIKPKISILTHFGMSMIKANPKELAKEISKKINLKVIAAEDDMEIGL